jgi:hypothetical protein
MGRKKMPGIATPLDRSRFSDFVRYHLRLSHAQAEVILGLSHNEYYPRVIGRTNVTKDQLTEWKRKLAESRKVAA